MGLRLLVYCSQDEFEIPTPTCQDSGTIFNNKLDEQISLEGHSTRKTHLKCIIQDKGFGLRALSVTQLRASERFSPSFLLLRLYLEYGSIELRLIRE